MKTKKRMSMNLNWNRLLEWPTDLGLAKVQISDWFFNLVKYTQHLPSRPLLKSVSLHGVDLIHPSETLAVKHPLLTPRSCRPLKRSIFQERKQKIRHVRPLTRAPRWDETAPHGLIWAADKAADFSVSSAVAKLSGEAERRTERKPRPPWAHFLRIADIFLPLDPPTAQTTSC